MQEAGTKPESVQPEARTCPVLRREILRRR
jgi:hypothetical protein